MTSARYVSLLFAVGCASPMSSLREDNQRLTQQVAQLRSERRTQERKLRDLQHQLDESRAQGVTLAVPQLPTEVVGPAGAPQASATSGTSGTPASSDGSRVVGVAEDGTEIVYEGEAIAGRPTTMITSEQLSQTTPPDDTPAPRRSRVAAAPLAPSAAEPLPAASGDHLEVTRRIPPISARAATRTKTRDVHDAPGERTTDASTDYRNAVELVKAGKHDDALVALRAFIAKYPRHDYADNAQYWIGEAYYAQKDYARALSEFRAVIEVYPRGNKVPDALLKVGYCYQQMGQGEKAHAILEQVVSRYPKSEPAALAAKRMETP
ncbi:MAG TPA: tol-pal system protein YbgF [Kofleriaceae bacterium]